MNTHPSETRPFNWINVIGPLLFVAAIATVIVRADFKRSTPGEIVDSRYGSNQGYRDFHNAIYYPVRALITGVNPYSTDYKSSYHPDGLGFPPFAPSSLLLHSPLGFLTVHVAEIAYLIVNICLLIFICWFSVRNTTYPFAVGAVFMMAALMVISRPGLLNFLGLQLTLLLILGTLLALEYSESNPFLSGFGLLLACCKPTYVIPLGFIMLCRRNFSAVAVGVMLCAVVNVGAIWLIASQNGGLETFVEDAKVAYAPGDAPLEMPEVRKSWSRLDVFSVVARWFDVSKLENLNFLVPLGVMLFGGLFAFLEIDPNHRTGINSRTGLLAILSMLISIYHQPYDALILWIPLVAFYLGDSKLNHGFGMVSRFFLVMLMMIPMINYVSTKLVLDRIGVDDGAASIPQSGVLEQFVHAWPWKLAVTFNGIAIALAAIIVVMAILRNWDHQRVPV